MEPKGTMNQAVTKVNVFGPEITNVTEADVAHLYGRQQYFLRQWQEENNSVGVLVDGMVQDGLNVNLGDLYSSVEEKEGQYAETSRKGRGLAKDYAEVGLGDNTLSEIRTRTRGSAQQIEDGFNTCTLLIHRGYK